MPTSSSGRRQFSLLNANNVRYSTPVLAAECEQRQVFDAVPGGILDDLAHGLHA
jgi:hypothetical protein